MTVVSVKRHRFDETKKYYLYPTSKQDSRSPNIILKMKNIVDKKYVDVVVDTLFCCVVFSFVCAVISVKSSRLFIFLFFNGTKTIFLCIFYVTRTEVIF
jgi:hypothetical protein